MDQGPDPTSESRADRHAAIVRQGIAVSPGVAVGTAWCLHDIGVRHESPSPDDQAVLDELTRYDRARELAAAELAAIREQLADQADHDEAGIYQVRETLLTDPAFTAEVRAWIVEEHHTVQAALQRLLHEYTARVTRVADEYLKHRLEDIRDVIQRIGAHLRELAALPAALPGRAILVAGELTPEQLLTLGNHAFAAVVTQAGGRTSRATILARSRGIPAVSGLGGLLAEVRDGDTLVVDGCTGRVVVRPDAAHEEEYRVRERRFASLKDALARNRDLPVVSADGQAVELLANVNSLGDLSAAVAAGAAGVGLLRTEYFFLTRSSLPDEEEQVQLYQDVIAASPPGPVTIRTLDVGGDLEAPFLGGRREANPFMGWRSIRLSFEHPDVFLRQIRAILRAGAGTQRPVRMMFPMITTLEELRRVRTLVRKAHWQLAAEGRPCPALPIGPMVEVPAAAMSIKALLKVADFVSIGSNDLVQYLMAADRDNPRVSHLCQPLSMAVLRVLAQVIEACNRAGKPVTLCGEIAGAPRAAMLLFGMGLRSFSTGPAFIPAVRELIRHLTVARAQRALEQALALGTSGRIVRHLTREIEELCPGLTLFDST